MSGASAEAAEQLRKKTLPETWNSGGQRPKQAADRSNRPNTTSRVRPQKFRSTIEFLVGQYHNSNRADRIDFEKVDACKPPADKQKGKTAEGH